MSTYYAAQRGTGKDNTRQAIAERRPFKSGGALSAKDESLYLGQTGQLQGKNRERFLSEQPSYVVRSYSTPIAWWSEAHGWTVPDTKYSVTTTRHQSMVRLALH